MDPEAFEAITKEVLASAETGDLAACERLLIDRLAQVRVGGQVKRRKQPVPPEEWVVLDGAHEALVDEATWDTVQARFERNRGRRIGRGKAPITGGRAPASVLSGMVRCSTCGRSFVVWTSGRNSKQRRRGTKWTQRRFACNRARSSGGDVCDNRTTVEASTLERASFDALEQHVLTEEGLAYLEAQRRNYLDEHLRRANGRNEALKKEWERIRQEEERVLSAVKAGLSLDGLRGEAERLAERRQQIGGAIDRLSKLEAAQATRMDQRLADTRLRHLREVLDAPDLAAVRAALCDLIVGIEACPDGSFWLLIGEGPLGSDDLAQLPPNPGGGDEAASGSQARTRAPGTPGARKNATPASPDGRTRGSRISMVGATPVDTYPRPVLGVVRLAI